MNLPETQPTLQSVLTPSDAVMFQRVGDEGVLLDLASEQYFGLNPVGVRVWELLDGQTALLRVQEILCSEYDGASARIGEDLLALARSLLEAGLALQR